MHPGPTVSIRSARDEDVESLLRLAQALGLPVDVRGVAEDMAAYATGFFVADTGAGIAGYLVLRREHAPDCVRGRAPLQLWKLYVASQFQGQGVATSLMSQAFAVAREWANDVVWLGTAEDNARAIAFYRKSGFAPIGFAACTRARRRTGT